MGATDFICLSGVNKKALLFIKHI